VAFKRPQRGKRQTRSKTVVESPESMDDYSDDGGDDFDEESVQLTPENFPTLKAKASTSKASR